MKRKGQVLAACMAVMMAFQLTGCGGWSTDDAEDYVTALLQVVSTGENTTGVEFSDLEADEVQAYRQSMFDDIVVSFDFSEYQISDETISSFEDVIDQALQNMQYEVGEAEKNDEGFEVPVTIRPIEICANVDIDAVTDTVIASLESGALEEADLSDEMLSLIIEQMSEGLDNPVYGDDYATTVLVYKNSDNVYNVSEEDTEQLGEHLIVYSDLPDVTAKWDEFYAANFVESVLQVLRDGESDTAVNEYNVSAEDGSELRQEFSDSTTDAMVSAVEAEGGTVSEETVQQLKDAFTKAISKVSYEVGDAVSVDDSVEVQVTFHPLDLYQGVDTDQITDKITAMYASGEVTDDTFWDKYLQLIAEMLSTSMDDPVYAEDHVSTLYVQVNTDGYYDLTEDSYNEIINYLFVTE